MSSAMENIANAFKDIIKQNGGVLELKTEDFDMALKSIKKGGCPCSASVGGKGKTRKTKKSKKSKKSKKTKK
jgi:hypothetical protein